MMRFMTTSFPTNSQMNLQENIDRIKEVMGVPKRVYDYDPERNTASDRLPLDLLKLIDAGVVFITPAIDGDPESPTYKQWLDEPGSHIITLYNVEHSSEDGWINKAITKRADPTPLHTKDFTQDLYDGKYNQILWGLEKLGIDPNTMLFEPSNINEASMNPYLLRRIPEFIRAVEDVADAIYVRSDRDFSESDFRNFLDRAIFGSIRDVIEHYDLTHEELGKLEIILSRIIYGDKDLLQRIKQIYISKLDLNSINEGETPISFKRRLPELIDSVLQSASYYNPNKYGASFDVFMERAIYAGIVTELPEDYYDSDLTKLQRLEDTMKEIILNDEKLLKKMKSIYAKRSKLKSQEGINESSTDPYLKRRFPELVQAVFEAAKWYVPSFMPDFETYVDRAIYSGIISVLSDTYADSNVDKMYELEDILRDTIYGNEDLLKKMKGLYNQV
jgi:predicted RNA-binding protein